MFFYEMRRVARHIAMAAAVFAAIASCRCADGLSVTVTNDSALERKFETVELQMDVLHELDSSISAENVVVLDSGGAQVPSQVCPCRNGHDMLLFQASVPCGESVHYVIKAGVRDSYDTLAYSRHVPERMDDYAYENNLVAGRIYGPALDFPRTLGSDIWVKNTGRLIIDEWFAKGDYHHNYGEGMDCYKVGGTLGGGALVPYSGSGELVTGDNWASFEHVCDGPVRTRAVFTYNAFDAGGARYSAFREIELDANTRFVKSVTTFCPVGHDADSLEVVLGAAMHDAVAYMEGYNWIAFTEKASDSSDPDADGNISVGLVYDTGSIASEPFVGKVAGHAGIVTMAAANAPVTVWTGSGWSLGGISSPDEWERIVRDFAYAAENPLKVSVRRQSGMISR